MLKYNLYRIYYFIIKNPIKLISLISIPFFYQIAGSFDPMTDKLEVISEIEQKTEWVYVVESKTGSIKYDILTFDERQDISKGFIIDETYHPLNVIFWILFIGAIAMVVIPTFIDDDDMNWDIEGINSVSILKIIDCELEDDVYYYVSMGRLLGKFENRIQTPDINYHLKVYDFDDIMRCPKFKTKKQDRDSKLDKLGV
jgi:hypothetical protein